MDCAKIKEYLHPYIDGVLPAATRRELEQHLQSCPDCAYELNQLRALSRALRSLPPADLPPGFSQILHQKLAAEPKPAQPALIQRGWVKAITAVAALLLLVVGVMALGSSGGTFSKVGGRVDWAQSGNSVADYVVAETPMLASPLPAEAKMMSEDIMQKIDYNYDYGAVDDVHLVGIQTNLAEAEQVSASMSAETDRAYDEEAQYSQDAPKSSETGGGGMANQRLERKIIRDANLSLKVDNVSVAYQRLNDMAAFYGGYVVSGNAYSYDGETIQRGYIMLRIDSNFLDEALTEIESLGKVENRNISAQDITMDYYDIAGRLKQYQTQEKRLLEIFDKAETVEDLVTVERELTQVRAQLESLNGQLRYYEQMTALSSISVDLNQPDQKTQTVRLGGWAGFLQDIKAGFISGVNALISGASSLTVGFARLLPLLLLIALVVVVLGLLIRRRLRK